MVENFEIYCDHVWACKNKTTGSMIKFLVPEESWGSIDSKYANIFEEKSRKVPRKLQETSGIFQENQILKFQNHENVVRQSGFDPLRAAKLCGIDRSHREGKTVLSDFQKNVSKKNWTFFCEIVDIFWKNLGKLFSFLGFSRGFPETFLKYFLKKCVQLELYFTMSTKTWSYHKNSRRYLYFTVLRS